jgi:hypothetical protein
MNAHIAFQVLRGNKMHYRSVVALSLASFSLAAVPLACSSSSPSGPAPDGGTSEDSGPSAADDASPSDAGSPDGSDGATAVDGSSDAGADSGDAAAGPVVLRVLTPMGPEPGVNVVFQDATGNTVLGTGTTDATGRYSQLVPAGSQVTVLLGSTQAPQLFTIQGVEPGDALTAFDWTSAGGEVSITALPAPVPTGTSSFTAQAGACTGLFTTTPGIVSVGPGCMGPSGEAPVLVTALDDASAPLGFAFEKNGTFAPNDAGIAQVSLASASWLSGSSAQTVQLPLAAGPSADTLSYSEVAGGVSFTSSTFLPTSTPDAGANADASAPPPPWTATLAGHDGFADFVQIEGSQAPDWMPSAMVSATREAAPTAPGTVALSADHPPWITAAAVDSFVQPQPLIQWQPVLTAAQGANVVGIVTMATWISPYVPKGTWTIVAPPTGTGAQAPVLPASLSSWAPGANSSFATPTVMTLQASMIADYDAFRPLAAAFPAPATIGAHTYLPPLPANGTATACVFAPPQP